MPGGGPDGVYKAPAPRAGWHSLLTPAAWKGEALPDLIRVAGDGATAVLMQDIPAGPASPRRGLRSAA